MGLPQEEKGLRLGEGNVRLGEGVPLRRGNVHLGEPEDGFCGVSGPPRKGFACLGKCRLHLGEPVIALRPMFMAYLGSVSWPGL